MASQVPPLKPATRHPRTAETQPSALGVHDTMRHGPSSLKYAGRARHPIENVQENWMQNEDALKMTLLRHAKGEGIVRRLQMERAIVSQARRLPVLHSSMLGLEVSLGREANIEFEDFLNDPRNTEFSGDVHTMTEASPFFK